MRCAGWRARKTRCGCSAGRRTPPGCAVYSTNTALCSACTSWTQFACGYWRTSAAATTWTLATSTGAACGTRPSSALLNPSRPSRLASAAALPPSPSTPPPSLPLAPAPCRLPRPSTPPSPPNCRLELPIPPPSPPPAGKCKGKHLPALQRVAAGPKRHTLQRTHRGRAQHTLEPLHLRRRHLALQRTQSLLLLLLLPHTPSPLPPSLSCPPLLPPVPFLRRRCSAAAGGVQHAPAFPTLLLLRDVGHRAGKTATRLSAHGHQSQQQPLCRSSLKSCLLLLLLLMPPS
jgi:hypothetical protein